MDKRKELQEAQEALEKVMAIIQEVKSELQSAKNWGLFDMIAGDMFASLIKRDKISKVNSRMDYLRRVLQEAQKELADVNITLASEISNSSSDYFWDVWFDNIFTDFRVQGELDKVAENINQLERQVGLALKDVKAALKVL
jgi:hypothetical protein